MIPHSRKIVVLRFEYHGINKMSWIKFISEILYDTPIPKAKQIVEGDAPILLNLKDGEESLERLFDKIYDFNETFDLKGQVFVTINPVYLDTIEDESTSE